MVVLKKKMLQYKVLLVSMSGELFLLRIRGTKNMTLHLSNSCTKIFLVLTDEYSNRTPLVSFLYERGWRQNFIWGGFPGLEREVMLLNYILCIRKFDCICETVSYVMNSNSTLLQCPKGDVKSMYNMQEATYNSFNYNKGNTYNITFITMWFD